MTVAFNYGDVVAFQAAHKSTISLQNDPESGFTPKAMSTIYEMCGGNPNTMSVVRHFWLNYLGPYSVMSVAEQYIASVLRAGWLLPPAEFERMFAERGLKKADYDQGYVFGMAQRDHINTLRLLDGLVTLYENDCMVKQGHYYETPMTFIEKGAHMVVDQIILLYNRYITTYHVSPFFPPVLPEGTQDPLELEHPLCRNPEGKHHLGCYWGVILLDGLGSDYNTVEDYLNGIPKK